MYIFTYIDNERILILKDPYEAALNADAVVIITEWDEFRSYNYQKIYDGMRKPAFLFDGRLILDGLKMKDIGFHVKAVGRVY